MVLQELPSGSPLIVSARLKHSVKLVRLETPDSRKAKRVPLGMGLPKQSTPSAVSKNQAKPPPQIRRSYLLGALQVRRHSRSHITSLSSKLVCLDHGSAACSSALYLRDLDNRQQVLFCSMEDRPMSQSGETLLRSFYRLNHCPLQRVCLHCLGTSASVSAARQVRQVVVDWRALASRTEWRTTVSPTCGAKTKRHGGVQRDLRACTATPTRQRSCALLDFVCHPCAGATLAMPAAAVNHSLRAWRRQASVPLVADPTSCARPSPLR